MRAKFRSSLQRPSRPRAAHTKAVGLKCKDHTHLVKWPEGKKPRSITPTALKALKVGELRRELDKRGASVLPAWRKKDLVEHLLGLLEAEAGAADGAAPAGTPAGAEATPAALQHNLAQQNGSAAAAVTDTAGAPRSAQGGVAPPVASVAVHKGSVNGAAHGADAAFAASSAANNGAHQATAHLPEPGAAPSSAALQGSEAQAEADAWWHGETPAPTPVAAYSASDVAPEASNGAVASFMSGIAAQEEAGVCANGSTGTPHRSGTSAAPAADLSSAASAADAAGSNSTAMAQSNPWPTAEERAPAAPERYQEPAPDLDFRGFPCSIDLDLLEGQSFNQIRPIVTGTNAAMPFWFLGTSNAAGGRDVHTACTVVRCATEAWMFDCGDDTQRQVMWTLSAQLGARYTIITRIFITSLEPCRVHGLPGMLATLSAAKGESEVHSETPVHLFGPPGLAAYLDATFTASDTTMHMPLVVHELYGGAVHGDEGEPEVLNRRAKLYRIAVPPDHLNPDGYITAILDTLAFARPRQRVQLQDKRRGGHRRMRIARTDGRDITRPPSLPPPGDPKGDPERPHEDLTWTLACDGDYKVVACGGAHHEAGFAPPDTFSYVGCEPNRCGNLIVDKAKALGVTPDRRYAELKAGFAVSSDTGDTIVPAQVCMPDIQGRQFCISGPSPHYPTILHAAGKRPLHIVVHEAWAQPEGPAAKRSDAKATPADLAEQAHTSCMFLSPRGCALHGVPHAPRWQDDKVMLAEAAHGMPDKVVLTAPANLDLAVLGTVSYDDADALEKIARKREELCEQAASESKLAEA